MSMTKEDIAKILEALSKVYADNGKKLQTATLYQGDKEEIIVDNREDTDLN